MSGVFQFSDATGAEVDVEWYVNVKDIILKNKGNQNTGNPQNHTPKGQQKNRLIN
ncbi:MULTISPECIES: hypothetical protein [Clostridia]|mgnify:FL=1|jgi:hypothetical protein|uniref:hypothetical protein n=1 Tax=Clostridia TaxID=186801 RepID=UPI0014041588|nr:MULTISPECIES: hypothetical protein [Clostridia]MDY6232779.1 hypothetical protein [Peptostreptococcus porci]